MINIYSGGEQIEYTAGDTFSVSITAAGGFEKGTKLNFQIAHNEQSEPVVNKFFELSEDGADIALLQEEAERLSIGHYIYKMTVIDSVGNITTRKSGEFTVKWGA